MVAAQQTDQQEFEGPDTSWRFLTSDTSYRVARHARVRDTVHRGNGAEQIQIVAGNGSYVHIGHSVPKARMIEELAPSIWVKSDRPGMQIMARAVLPRSQDPRSGQPMTTLVRGDVYQDVGSWQQLRVPNILELLAQRVRVLRSQHGPLIDGREAFVDRLVLNIYGGSGATTIWIDDLEMRGLVTARSSDKSAGSPPPARRDTLASARMSLEPQPAEIPDVELQGPLLVVRGRAMLPRVVEYRGEPLEDLARLGFNVVLVDAMVTPALLDEAANANLWLIARPPAEAQLSRRGEPYKRVIAWDLGRGLAGTEIKATRELARRIRATDPQPGRPLVCSPDAELRAYSRVADILIVGRNPIGSSMSLAEYANWCGSRKRLARPGTPMWLRIQTDYDPRLRGQWAALGDGSAPDPPVDDDQVRTLVRIAIAAGARGLVFDSHAPLTAARGDVRRRAATLELLNLELKLIEPWAAGGSYSTSANSSDTEISGVALLVDRARLLLPIRVAEDDAFVTGHSSASSLSFVVPGVPESNDAYELTPVGVRPLKHQRVTGGIRVTQDGAMAGSMILLSGDAQVVRNLSVTAAQSQRRAAELAYELSARKADAISDIQRRLGPAVDPEGRPADYLGLARESVATTKQLLVRRDYARAYYEARRALAMLARSQRGMYQRITTEWPVKVASPAAVSLTMLPEHVTFARGIAARQAGAGLLTGGDFEKLSTMIDAGWRHFQHPAAGVQSDVELSAAAPQQGSLSLKMQAWPEQPDNPVVELETPPVWVTTPPTNIQAGQILRIHGWVRVPTKIKGSVDGLMIIDSLAGPTLAQRIHQTDVWQEFSMYRIAAESGELTVTFALTGLGQVWLDGVTIAPLDIPVRPMTRTPQATRLHEILGVPGRRY